MNLRCFRSFSCLKSQLNWQQVSLHYLLRISMLSSFIRIPCTQTKYKAVELDRCFRYHHQLVLMCELCFLDGKSPPPPMKSSVQFPKTAQIWCHQKLKLCFRCSQTRQNQSLWCAKHQPVLSPHIWFSFLAWSQVWYWYYWIMFCKTDIYTQIHRPNISEKWFQMEPSGDFNSTVWGSDSGIWMLWFFLEMWN